MIRNGRSDKKGLKTVMENRSWNERLFKKTTSVQTMQIEVRRKK